MISSFPSVETWSDHLPGTDAPEIGDDRALNGRGWNW